MGLTELTQWGIPYSIDLDPLSAAAAIIVAAVGGLIAWLVRRRARNQAELQAFSEFRQNSGAV